MNKPPAQTILRWLRENDIKLGALTHHDTRALLAAAQIAELWIHGGNRRLSAVAFANVVLQMQPDTRYMAFHAIAHVGDWCHRAQLWHADQDPPLKGVKPEAVIRIAEGVKFTRIVGGMTSGRSSVAITAPLPDGRHVFIELSMGNFELVAAGFRGAEQRARECDGRN